MRRVILVGTSDRWEHFAEMALRLEELEPVHFLPEQLLDPAFPIRIDDQDLMLLSPLEGQRPSVLLERLFQKLGPVRVVVVDSRADYARLGDALRACAVAYAPRPWNREELLKLIEDNRDRELPHPVTLDRRFGPWEAEAAAAVPI